MKKYIAMIFAIGVIIAGVAATSVSAKEHTVEKGDNLWNIAKEYNTTIDELVELNDLPTTVIQPNQVIQIYQVHEVEKGESLFSVGEDYGVTIEELREWNNLQSNLLFVGQELTITDVSEVDEEATEVAAKPTEKNKQTEENPEVKEKKQTETKQSSGQAQAQEKTPASPEGKTLTVTATAYTAECDGCSGVTYTGIDLRNDRNAKVIAVDPTVIPLGSRVYVEGYGEAIAGDIGGAIKGNRIDLHVPTKDEAYSWGVREVKITVLD